MSVLELVSRHKPAWMFQRNKENLERLVLQRKPLYVVPQ